MPVPSPYQIMSITQRLSRLAGQLSPDRWAVLQPRIQRAMQAIQARQAGMAKVREQAEWQVRGLREAYLPELEREIMQAPSDIPETYLERITPTLTAEARRVKERFMERPEFVDGKRVEGIGLPWYKRLVAPPPSPLTYLRGLKETVSLPARIIKTAVTAAPEIETPSKFIAAREAISPYRVGKRLAAMPPEKVSEIVSEKSMADVFAEQLMPLAKTPRARGVTATASELAGQATDIVSNLDQLLLWMYGPQIFKGAAVVATPAAKKALGLVLRITPQRLRTLATRLAQVEITKMTPEAAYRTLGVFPTSPPEAIHKSFQQAMARHPLKSEPGKFVQDLSLWVRAQVAYKRLLPRLHYPEQVAKQSTEQLSREYLKISGRLAGLRSQLDRVTGQRGWQARKQAEILNRRIGELSARQRTISKTSLEAFGREPIEVVPPKMGVRVTRMKGAVTAEPTAGAEPVSRPLRMPPRGKRVIEIAEGRPVPPVSAGEAPERLATQAEIIGKGRMIWQGEPSAERLLTQEELIRQRFGLPAKPSVVPEEAIRKVELGTRAKQVIARATKAQARLDKLQQTLKSAQTQGRTKVAVHTQAEIAKAEAELAATTVIAPAAELDLQAQLATWQQRLTNAKAARRVDLARFAQAKVSTLQEQLDVETLPSVALAKAPLLAAREAVAVAPAIPTKVPGRVQEMQIARYLADELDVPLYKGGFRQRALAIFKRGPRIARYKKGGLSSVSHEIAGHYVQEVAPELRGEVVYGIAGNELKSLVAAFPKGKQTPTEMMAEFMKLYVTEPEQAASKMPTAYAYVDSVLQSRYPKIATVLLNARQKWQVYKGLPAQLQYKAGISYDVLDKAAIPKFDNAYRHIVDADNPLRQATAMVRAHGIKLTDEEDAYTLARLMRGWTGKGRHFVEYKTFDTKLNLKHDGLIPTMKAAIFESQRKGGSFIDDFDTYITARRVPDLLKKGITEFPFPPEKAAQVIRHYESQFPSFRQVADKLKNYDIDLLSYMRDAELMSPETYSRIIATNPMYSPYYRAAQQYERGAYTAEKLGRTFLPIKRIRGGREEIVSPTESRIRNTYTFLNMAERNRTKLALAKAARLDPQGLGRIVEEVPRAVAPVAQVSPTELGMLREAGIDLPDDLLKQVATIFRGTWFAPKGTMTLLEGGQLKHFQVHDELLQRSIENLDEIQLGVLGRVLGTPARILRAGTVLYSPEFVAKNPIRDQFTAFVLSKYGYKPPFDFFRGLFSLVNKDAEYWSWVRSGGSHSMLVSLDRTYLQQNLGELINELSLKGKAKNFVRHPMEGLRIASEQMEAATRLGEFIKGGRIPGETLFQRGLASRDVTLDFGRMGVTGKALNQIIAFWNANVQDVDRVARALKEQPQRTLTRAILGITVPSVALYAVNRGDPEYLHIPQWQRDLFWIVPIWKEGKVVSRIRVPKPFLLGMLFGTSVERVLEYLDSKDPQAFDELAKNIMSTASPGWMPTAATGILGAWTGKKFFPEIQDIVPQYLEREAPERQYTAYTSETAKALGQLIKQSPAKIDYLVQSYFGRLGTLLRDGADEILRKVAKDKLPLEPTPRIWDRPMLRAFVVPEPVGSRDELVTQFYETLRRAEMLESRMGGLPISKVELFKMEHPEVTYLPTLKKIALHGGDFTDPSGKQWSFKIGMADVRKEIQQIRLVPASQMSADEKRIKIDALERLISDMASATMSALDAVRLANRTWLKHNQGKLK